MSRRERTLHHSWPAGTPEAQHALRPRVDLVEEVVTSTDSTSTAFAQRDGPFTTYERRVVDGPKTVDETIRYRIVIPYFGWLFALPVRGTLRQRFRGEIQATVKFLQMLIACQRPIRVGEHRFAAPI